MNDLAGVTVADLSGAAFADYTYYSFTEGEKTFDYAWTGLPTCAGFTQLEASGNSESLVSFTITKADGSVEAVGTDRNVYDNCVTSASQACFYNDISAKKFYVNVYSADFDGDNNIIARPVIAGYDGLSATSTVSSTYTESNSATFKLTVMPGSADGF